MASLQRRKRKNSRKGGNETDDGWIGREERERESEEGEEEERETGNVLGVIHRQLQRPASEHFMKAFLGHESTTMTSIRTWKCLLNFFETSFASSKSNAAGR